MARARSGAEQERIVLAWRRSGQAARAYAAQVGVSAASLHRWSSSVNKRHRSAAGTLVEVVPSGASAEAWEWELELAAGTLRGRAVLEPATTRAIVEALTGVSRR
jgi:transposase